MKVHIVVPGRPGRITLREPSPARTQVAILIDKGIECGSLAGGGLRDSATLVRYRLEKIDGLSRIRNIRQADLLGRILGRSVDKPIGKGSTRLQIGENSDGARPAILPRHTLRLAGDQPGTAIDIGIRHRPLL